MRIATALSAASVFCMGAGHQVHQKNNVPLIKTKSARSTAAGDAAFSHRSGHVVRRHQRRGHKIENTKIASSNILFMTKTTCSPSNDRTISKSHRKLPELDKFQLFEQWLRVNGAKSPLLELRKYDSPKKKTKKKLFGADGERSFQRDDGRANDYLKEKPSHLLTSDQNYIEKGENKCDNLGKSKKTNSESNDEKDDGSKEMRGVHALKTIPPETTVVSIPKACFITVEMGKSTPIGRKILNSDLEVDALQHIFLMIYLLWDKKVNGHNSFFAPFYDILPKQLRNMPIFWDKEELAYLEGSHLSNEIDNRIEGIEKDYNDICKVAPEFGGLATLEEFQWAQMIVSSRNFGLNTNGRHISALVPHADMLNHCQPKETKWGFDDESQCFEITTLQTIGIGAQIHDSYGHKCNHRFLLNYGFSLEDNRESDGSCPNEVPLELGLDMCFSGGVGDLSRNDEIVGSSEDDRKCWDKKLDFCIRGGAGAHFYGGGGLGAAGGVSEGNFSSSFQVLAAAVAGTTERVGALSSDRHVHVSASNNENTLILFSMLRVLACNSAELDHISWGGKKNNPFYGGSSSKQLFGISNSLGKTSSDSGSSHTSLRTCRDIRYPINLHNDRRAMELLLEITDRALSKYPTSLAYDTEDLLDELVNPRYSNKRNAKLQVRGEKEVLHHFAQWARTAMNIIDIILNELSVERKMVQSNSSSVDFKRTVIGEAINKEEQSFDSAIQAMEEDDDCHSTILRYCSDILGAIRWDELNRITTNAT